MTMMTETEANAIVSVLARDSASAQRAVAARLADASAAPEGAIDAVIERAAQAGRALVEATQIAAWVAACERTGGGHQAWWASWLADLAVAAEEPSDWQPWTEVATPATPVAMDRAALRRAVEALEGQLRQWSRPGTCVQLDVFPGALVVSLYTGNTDGSVSREQIPIPLRWPDE